MVFLILDKKTKSMVNTVKAEDRKDLLENWDYSDKYYDIHEFSSTEEAVAYLDDRSEISNSSDIFMP